MVAVGEWSGLVRDPSTRPRVGTRGWWAQLLSFVVVIVAVAFLLPRLNG